MQDTIQNNTPKFTWVPFYKELAKALLRFKEDRTPLIEWCRNNLSKEKRGENYDDIDPLNLFRQVHRFSNLEKRTKYMERLKTFLSLESDLPSDYAGVGILTHWNLVSRVSSPIYVSNNWNLFEKLLGGQPFAAEFDFIIQDTDFCYHRQFPLSRVLSWINPEKYLPLDTKMITFLRKKGITVPSVPNKMTYTDYIKFLEKIKNHIEKGSVPYNNFLEILEAANSVNEDISDSSVTPIVNNTSETRDYWIWREGTNAFNKSHICVEFPITKTERTTFQIDNDITLAANSLRFGRGIKTGDIIVVADSSHVNKKNQYELYGWGIIVSDAFRVKDSYLIRSVDWKKKCEDPIITSFVNLELNLLQKLTDEQAESIKSLLGIELREQIAFNAKSTSTMPTEYRMPDPIVKTAKKLLDNAGQIILQGAPGCGKTYITTELAVYLCDGQVPASRAALKARYKELEAEGRIGFTTFHQSLDYEEFVEGMKPDTENTDPSTGSGQASEMRFVVKPGIFKRMCERASMGDAPHVLIIDEINRANISKVLGELITLIEKTKRIGAEDEFCVTLPYSGERFGVPQNLYIIGTMNTADRSLGYIDYAIRRRFAFLPLKSEWAVVREFYGDRGELMNRQHELYTRIRNLVKDHLNEDFLLDDVMIGHSYFLAAKEEDYKLNLDYKIRPLLEEYLRDGILVEDGTVKDTIKNLR